MRLFSRLLLAGAALALSGSLTSVAAQETAEDKGPEVMTLTGAPMGGVKFMHAAHQKMTECASCHHESKAEKPMTSANQKCSSCHVKEPEAPMKTNAKLAFHDTANKTGVCLSCHIKEAEAGKTVPVKCAECHKKENT